MLGIGPLNDIVLPAFVSTDVTTYFNAEHFDARVFWNRLRADNSLNVNYIGQSLLPARAEQNVVDGELVYKAKLELSEGPRQRPPRSAAPTATRTSAGRTSTSDASSTTTALFVHDELKIGSLLAFVADYRVDWVPYLERFQQSPRGAVLVHPVEAVDRPRVGRDRLPQADLPRVVPRAPDPAARHGRRADLRGRAPRGPELHPQRRAHPLRRARLPEPGERVLRRRRVGLLQPRLEPHPARRRTAPLTVGDFASGGRTGPADRRSIPVGLGGWENQCQAYNVYGGEAGVRTFPIEGLDIYAQLHAQHAAAGQLELHARSSSRASSPTSARACTRSTPASSSAPSRASTARSTSTTSARRSGPSRSRTSCGSRSSSSASRSRTTRLLNARLGYRFLGNQAELSVNALQPPRRPAPRASVRSARRSSPHGDGHLPVLIHAHRPLLRHSLTLAAARRARERRRARTCPSTTSATTSGSSRRAASSAER